ncbi:porphobilinogen synthase [Chloroflexus aggregans]|uniref:Delta-aminolevulinic acid dehydratase n=1 Tax=Chloroflexus aggregans (strain MD-66 / DSM 9485) TaxID=326427 RepID=B8G820_CHLAD|nr:porphobilinogen synthase [Chloroflexus aggregans]ACL24199.1 Porphobilinogen synthase [Chloroflexus aggregans DSM 9485]
MEILSSRSPATNGIGQQLPVPIQRPRRLRISPALRDLVRETRLTPAQLIAPIFVRHGHNLRVAIRSMPGQYQLSPDQAAQEAKQLAERGIRAVLLFGIPAHKDACGSENADPDGIVPQAIQAIKAVVPGMVVISDMCFCEYTDHGHCGVLNTPDRSDFQPQLGEGYLLNDATLSLLAEASVVHARAGADIIAPSGMIDGMVATIRAALDTAGFTHTSIMSYAAKYASAFYGPFRDAAESPPKFGDRSQYQMDPANAREAIREVDLDVAEGADILMVKPALAYLDIIRQVRDRHTLPLAAYQVSGEYSMVKAAALQGWLDEQRIALETLTAIRRAGADMIITYWAKEAAEWLD